MSFRTPLFLDKLSLTIAIPSSQHTEVRNRLEGMLTEELVFEETDRYSELLKGYRNAYYIPLSAEVRCYIQIFPRKIGSRFMRIEWNPRKALLVAADAPQRIIHTLNECIPNFSSTHLLTSNITRIDLAFDIHRASMENIHVHTTLRRTYSHQYYQLQKEFDRHGKLNSVALGRSISDQYLLLYDKTLEQETRQFRRFTPSSEGTASTPNRRRIKINSIRFELRLRKNLRFENLATMPNPFLKYNVALFGRNENANESHEWTFFLDSCLYRGIQNSLSMIENPKTRSRYAAAIAHLYTPSWWQPDELWGEVSGAISVALGLDRRH